MISVWSWLPWSRNKSCKTDSLFSVEDNEVSLDSLQALLQLPILQKEQTQLTGQNLNTCTALPPTLENQGEKKGEQKERDKAGKEKKKADLR